MPELLFTCKPQALRPRMPLSMSISHVRVVAPRPLSHLGFCILFFFPFLNLLKLYKFVNRLLILCIFKYNFCNKQELNKYLTNWYHLYLYILKLKLNLQDLVSRLMRTWIQNRP